MTGAQYRGPAGPLLLGPDIGRGGEGQVFALADGSGRALKVYDRPDAAREAKVRAMIAAGLSRTCTGVAFPQELATCANGAFAGFTMSLVQACRPIHELYSPSSRRREFPDAGWPFLVRSALNTARSFAQVHAAGAVVGDVNGSGILVSKQALVTLIDADSFQWGPDHPCRVGMPEFTPPELQVRSLEGVTRTINHDAFGLAVIVFQLLFLGRHPFAGVPRGRDLALPQAIREGAFAYSAIRKVSLKAPRGTLLVTDLPIGLALLFERAFATGVGARPNPGEWMAELERLESKLSACGRNDRHSRPGRNGACPWCRVERAGGRSLFGVGAAGTGEAPPQKSAMTLIAEGSVRRGRAASGDRLQPRTNKCATQPSARAIACQPGLAGSGSALTPSFLRHLSQKDRQFFEDNYRRAREGLNMALDDWRSRIGAWKAHHLVELLADGLHQLERCERGLAADVASVESRLRQRHMQRELTATPIERAAAAPGIGQRRLAVLSKSGIVTAGDISRSALEVCKGVGEQTIDSLLLWKIALTVRIDRSFTITADEITTATAELRRSHGSKIVTAERTLDRMVQELEASINAVLAKSRFIDLDVQSAEISFCQACVDLEHLGVSVPIARSPATVIPTGTSSNKVPTTRRAKDRTDARCPRCGGAMVARWTGGGGHPAGPFLGCTSYPSCLGTRPLGGAKP